MRDAMSHPSVFAHVDPSHENASIRRRAHQISSQRATPLG
jgi:hypothetical protein